MVSLLGILIVKGVCVKVVLSKMLDQAAEKKIIGYHPYCQGFNLTHLCFADDLLVFADGKKTSIAGVLDVFKEFEVMSGLQISLEKSSLYTARITDEDSADILSQFPIQYGLLPVRYLGLPLMSKRMTGADYTPLVERVRSRIQS